MACGASPVLMICLTVPDNLFLKASNKTRILTDAFAAQQTARPAGAAHGLSVAGFSAKMWRAGDIDVASTEVDALAGVCGRLRRDWVEAGRDRPGALSGCSLLD